jgi:hypothetical protein
MPSNFAPDPQLQEIAEAYALDALDHAKDTFNVELDWSDDSIQQIETILGVFHDTLAEESPPEDAIMTFAKIWGSYIGEVFRRNHGASWGSVTLGADTIPGMKATTSDVLFWPWGRVRDRLLDGPASNVWHYYQGLVS